MTMVAQAPMREALGHPRGLFVLFFAEMWERFSYYGMRALLIFYLTQHFLFPDAEASRYYGAYTSLVYAFSILGGFLADQFFGQWRSVRIGGALILSGHIALAVEGALGDASPLGQQVFFLGLGLIIAGTGLFKPCISTLVGALYAQGDGRRQTGFFIFYVGINTGSALAALSVGYLGQTFGWSYGFGAAAVGMALGLAFLSGGKAEIAPYAPAGAKPDSNLWRAVAIALGAALIAYALVQRPTITGITLLIVLVGGLVVIGRYAMTEADTTERRHILVCVLLFFGVSVFWSAFELAGSALNLFAARLVDLTAFGVTLRPSQTQSFNATFIILCSPLMAALWAYLARRGREPSVGFKFAIGLILAALSFEVLVQGLAAAGPEGKVALAYLVAYYLLQTLGELCVSPIGLSTMTTLAPQRVQALIMGLWFMGAAAGNFLAGQIAVLTARPDSGEAAGEAARYAEVFANVSIYALAAGLVFILIGLPIKNWAAIKVAVR